MIFPLIDDWCDYLKKYHEFLWKIYKKKFIFAQTKYKQTKQADDKLKNLLISLFV